MGIRNATLIALAAALAAAPVALAADAHLRIPGDPVSRASKVAQVVFDVPSGWTQMRSAMTGAATTGFFERSVEIEPGAACVLELEVTGMAEPTGGRYVGGHLHVPRPASFELQDLVVAARGTRGSVRWYRGRVAGDEVVGAAILPTPRGLAPKRLRKTIVRAAIAGQAQAWSASQPLTVTGEQVEKCRSIVRTVAPAALRALLPTVRVERIPAS